MEGPRGLKRKLGLAASSARKKLKGTSQPVSKGKARKTICEHSTTVSANDLPWKSVRTQNNVGAFGGGTEGGMLMLEEVENVEVVYEGGGGASIIGFRVKDPAKIHETNTGGEPVQEASPNMPSPPILVNLFDMSLLPSWEPYPLHSVLLHSIHKRGFEHPTQIQKRTLEVFLHTIKPRDKEGDIQGCGGGGEMAEVSFKVRERDIVGIAETGSGKTLAYGFPILHDLLTTISSLTSTHVIVHPPVSTERRPLRALILVPTRELALQVSEHLNACLDQLFTAQGEGSQHVVGDQTLEKNKITRVLNKLPPPISVATVVGGMSTQKQRRILSRGVDILVATPGRFWDLCGEDPVLTAQLRELRFLVLDEADRMVETGHFQELDEILRMTARSSSNHDSGIVQDQAFRLPANLACTNTGAETRLCNDLLQTFVFSATMNKELQRDLKRKRGEHGRKGTSATTLDDLLMRLDFRHPDPVIIDLSPEGGRVEHLQESRVECLAKDKDMYLYYFLLRHPGRTLVFLASIDGIRRLMPILQLLKFNTWPLHSDLQQKQRLKNLDRFKSTSNSVLLATDVAARGLDIPAVDHVIHYQVPRTADAYVHRNGRTARAMREGFGLVLCAPDERRVFRRVLAGLDRDGDDVPELSVEHDLVDKLKARMQLARKIDGAAHRIQKANYDRKWIRETAEAVDIVFPSDIESDASEEASRSLTKRSSDAQIAAMKADLKQLLAEPLVARGVSTRYITSGSRSIANDLIHEQNNESILGLKKVEAGSEGFRSTKKKGRRKPKDRTMH